MRRSFTVVLLALVGCGGAEPAEDEEPATPTPPTVEELLAGAAEASGPVAGVAIAIDPDVRAWDSGRDRWAVEATLTVTNRGAEPLDFIPARIRLRDPERVLVGQLAAEQPTRLEPGQSTQLNVTASPVRPGDSGRPTELVVDYGTAGHMSPEARAPISLVSTEGLRATFSSPSPAERVHTPHVRSRGSLPAWRVRLRMTVRNPTDGLRRMPYGGLVATREGGAESYWGDHAGISIADRWFAAGAERTAQLTLMFVDSPAPPRRLTLRYGGETQQIELPAAQPVPDF